jgi:hypothetical protein
MNGMTETQFGRDRKRGKASDLRLNTENKQWLWTLKTMSDTVMNTRKVIRDFKDRVRQNKLDRTGTAYIWHSKQERNICIIKMIKRQICNDNEIQNLFSKMSVISLEFYQNKEYCKWCRELYRILLQK